MASEAKRRANIAYNRRQDSITIRPSKAEGARIRAAAADAGMSVQAYILGLSGGGDSQLPNDSGTSDSSMPSR